MSGRNAMMKLGKALAVVMVAALGAGCAIHTQGPVREVAADFSDAHFYDRAYAPSPQYLAEGEMQQVPALRPAAHHAAPHLPEASVVEVVEIVPPAAD